MGARAVTLLRVKVRIPVRVANSRGDKEKSPFSYDGAV
jgi:hypothetical protein